MEPARYCKMSVTTTHLVSEQLDLPCHSTLFSNLCYSVRLKNQDLQPYRTDNIRQHMEINRMAKSQPCLENSIPDNPAISDEMAINKCVWELSGNIPGDHTTIFHSQVLSKWQTVAFSASKYSGWKNTWRTGWGGNEKSQEILHWCSGQPPPEVCNLSGEEVEGWPVEWYNVCNINMHTSHTKEKKKKCEDF